MLQLSERGRRAEQTPADAVPSRVREVRGAGERVKPVCGHEEKSPCDLHGQARIARGRSLPRGGAGGREVVDPRRGSSSSTRSPASSVTRYFGEPPRSGLDSVLRLELSLDLRRSLPVPLLLPVPGSLSLAIHPRAAGESRRGAGNSYSSKPSDPRLSSTPSLKASAPVRKPPRLGQHRSGASGGSPSTGQTGARWPRPAPHSLHIYQVSPRSPFGP